MLSMPGLCSFDAMKLHFMRLTAFRFSFFDCKRSGSSRVCQAFWKNINANFLQEPSQELFFLLHETHIRTHDAELHTLGVHNSCSTLATFVYNHSSHWDSIVIATDWISLFLFIHFRYFLPFSVFHRSRLLTSNEEWKFHQSNNSIAFFFVHSEHFLFPPLFHIEL